MSLLVLLCMISLLIGCSKKNPDEQKFRLIADSMSAIYMPESIELFETSKDYTTNRLYTKDIADRLYRSYGKQLSERDKSRNIVVDIASSIKSSNETQTQPKKYKVNVILNDNTNKPMIIQYIMTENQEGLIDTLEQRQLEQLPILSEESKKDIQTLGIDVNNIKTISETTANLKSDGNYGYTTSCIERNTVDKQILEFVAEASKLIENSPPIYFIYGSMLVEAGITDSANLYDKGLSDIYQDMLIGKGGEKQYTDGDIKSGEIIRDTKAMIGPFQISSAYYDTWTKLVPDELIESVGGLIPTDITNRGNTGQPLYLPDVIYGKLEICSNKIEEADRYMKEHYDDWDMQPDIVKKFFGTMWYNIEYHGGTNGILHAKENSIILDYLYDISKEVYKDNNFLDDINDWTQASKLDNECIKQICRKIDPNGSKGYLAGYKKYAKEGDDTFLGDWNYAPKCLHFGLKKLESLAASYS